MINTPTASEEPGQAPSPRRCPGDHSEGVGRNAVLCAPYSPCAYAIGGISRGWTSYYRGTIGTPDRVRAFAHGRAAECSEAEYVAETVGADLTTEDEMAEMEVAWSRWGESRTAYAAFTWCRALARRGPVPR